MIALKFLSELGRKKIVTLLVMQLLLTHDVVTMKGLAMEEVVIAEIPCDTCAEIVCTIATIEPADSDFKYEKYIADSMQTKFVEYAWQDKPEDVTFEACASAANSTGSKMFLFDDGQCKVSPLVFEKMDPCKITQTQLVYIEAEADVNVFTRNLTCNSYVVTQQVDDEAINTIFVDDAVGECKSKLLHYASFSSEYIFFAPDYKIPMENIAAECQKFGATACAPEQGKDTTAFAEDLKKFYGASAFNGNYITVGLSSNDSGGTFFWTTGVSQPTTPVGQNGWGNGEPLGSSECVVMASWGLSNAFCGLTNYFCCSLPYFAE